jgi:response regulator RpfG family c-di-GMP phosphodiesterase
VKATIFIAEDTSVISIISHALEGCYELIEVTTLPEAKRLSAGVHIDLFIIGIHFDDSHALELVKFIRTESDHKKAPLLIIRLLPSQNPQILLQTIEVMKPLQQIGEYLELEFDSDQPKQIRNTVERLLQSTVIPVVI